MVILFSDRKSTEEKEIVEILTNAGATYISDKVIKGGNNHITIVSAYKKAEFNINKGVAILFGAKRRFDTQEFPIGIIGICEADDKEALEVFSKSPIAVISCGMGRKNTVTLSSINADTALLTFQRTLTDIKGNTIEPAEYKIRLKDKYRSFSIMASATILLLYGIKPEVL